MDETARTGYALRPRRRRDEIDDDELECSVTFTPIHLFASRRLAMVGGEDLQHMEWAYRRFEE